jgi:hypothetical protein
MLLPDKHIGFAESLIGLGSFVLENLVKPRDVDTIWKNFEKVRGGEFPAFHSFDNLVLAIDMLFAIGAIDLMANGQIVRCALESELCA